MNFNTLGQFGQFCGSPAATMGSAHSFCNNYNGQSSWQQYPPPGSCDFRRFYPFVINRLYYPLSPSPMFPVPQFPPALNHYFPPSSRINYPETIRRELLVQNGEDNHGVIIEDVSESAVERAESVTKMADEIFTAEIQALRRIGLPANSDTNGDEINPGPTQPEDDGFDSQDEIVVDDYDDEEDLGLDRTVHDSYNGNAAAESNQVQNNAVHGAITDDETGGSEIPSDAQTNPAGLIPLENVLDGPGLGARRSDRLRRKLSNDEATDQNEDNEGQNISKKRSKWLQCRRKNCFCCTYKP